MRLSMALYSPMSPPAIYNSIVFPFCSDGRHRKAAMRSRIPFRFDNCPIYPIFIVFDESGRR